MLKALSRHPANDVRLSPKPTRTTRFGIGGAGGSSTAPHECGEGASIGQQRPVLGSVPRSSRESLPERRAAFLAHPWELGWTRAPDLRSWALLSGPNSMRTMAKGVKAVGLLKRASQRLAGWLTLQWQNLAPPIPMGRITRVSRRARLDDSKEPTRTRTSASPTSRYTTSRRSEPKSSATFATFRLWCSEASVPTSKSSAMIPRERGEEMWK